MPSTWRTVFIIDDDDSVRKALRRLLRAAGHHAEAFATAEEFLQAASPAPDALVLDVHLPGLGGLELQQQLKAQGRAVPIVFITAYEEEQTRACALAEGAVAFLYKPFDEQALLDAVDRALGQARGPG